MPVRAGRRTGSGWMRTGTSGAAGGWATSALDGVMVFNQEGAPIGRIQLPERCANLCFGGRRRNRLFMAASQSIYALYMNTRGVGLGVRRVEDSARQLRPYEPRVHSRLYIAALVDYERANDLHGSTSHVAAGFPSYSLGCPANCS